MKRPMLISGITMTTVCAFLMIFSKIAAVVVLVTSALVFFFYLIKPLNLRKHIIIPAVCISSLLISVSFLTYTHFKIDPFLQYDSQTVYVAGKVITTPVSKNGYTTFTLKTENISGKKEVAKIDVTLPENSAKSIKLYDFISIDEADISIARNENNMPDLSQASDEVLLTAHGNSVNFLWHAKRTPFYYCLRFREIISNKISAFTQPETGVLLKGMLFGNSSDIEYGTLKAFRHGGISHLLAVSGLHTSLWCGLLILILKLFKVPEKARNIVCIIFLIAFCAVASFTPSVMRASLMMLVILIAPFFKRKPDSFNSLGFAVTILLLINPYIVTSASFRLSVTATLGVLTASSYETKIQKKTALLKPRPIRSVCSYILSSVLLSISAGIFTLPVSAYYFGVFSVISPITNILCVKLAFYGMISGTVATGLAFTENIHIKNIAIFIFDITEHLLNAVIDISNAFSKFKYCTVPVHKEWLIYGLIAAALIIFTGYILHKLKHNSKLKPATAIFAVVALFINILIPVLPTPVSNTLTVLSAGNNMHVVIRSGTHYMYIVNSEECVPSDIFAYLPKAACETLDYYLATYLSHSAVYDLQYIKRSCEPAQTHITPSIKYIAESKSIDFPENTVISTRGKYTLNAKINVEIVDTYRMKYVIIKGNEKTIYIHLYGNTDFSEVVDTSPGDIFVYNGTAPEEIPETAETVILSAKSSILTDNNYETVKATCSDVYVTAKDGDVQIIL